MTSETSILTSIARRWARAFAGALLVAACSDGEATVPSNPPASEGRATGSAASVTGGAASVMGGAASVTGGAPESGSSPLTTGGVVGSGGSGAGGAGSTGGPAGAPGSIGGAADTDASATSGGGTGGASPLPPVRVFIAGDSTVANQSSATPAFFGWGQWLDGNFNDAVTVQNEAVGGRSVGFFMYQVARDTSGAYACVDSTGNPRYETDASGARIATAQWKRIQDGLRAGDYLLIQFGANDATSTCPRHVSTSDYQVLLGTMAKVTQEKGATPIFVTPTSQLSCGSGTPQPTLTAYADAAKAAGRASGVPVIDLNALTVEHYRSLGCAKTTSTVFAPDQATHFTEPGAKAVAGLVAKALITIQSPLARYLQ